MYHHNKRVEDPDFVEEIRTVWGTINIRPWHITFTSSNAVSTAIDGFKMADDVFKVKISF